MKITATKPQFQSIVKKSFSALIQGGFPVKYSVLQDKIALLLTDGDRKYSSLLSDWVYDNTQKTFVFHPFVKGAFRGFEKSWYEAIYPCLEARVPFTFAPVCIKSDMRPIKIINSDNRLYQVASYSGSYQNADLGNYFKKYCKFSDKTYEFAIFDLELTEFFGEPAVQFSLQTLVDGEVRQQSYFAEWLLKNGSCSRRDSNLKMNQADDLSRLFETDDMPSSMPLLDKIPFNLIHDALDDIMEREDRLIVWKDASDMIDLADKIETAKNFAGLHKNKIFGLVAYSDDEVVPDSVYLEIWDYIWRTLNTDDIYLGAEPYIELSQHETKSGHTEIFNVSADDITYLLDYDRLGLKEFTVKAFLDNFDYEADDILINPDTGSEDTAENWAADFVSHWGDMAYLPSMFFSLDLKD